MKFELISLNYRAPKSDLRIEQLPLVVGCSPEAGIYLDEPSISMNHCRIELRGDHLVICDLDSVHGTFVNGARVREATLEPGDELAIGILSFYVLGLEEADQEEEVIDVELEESCSGV